jgi:hypothetical protein
MEQQPLDYERPSPQRPQIPEERGTLPRFTISDLGRPARIVLGSFLLGCGLVTAFRYVQLSATFGRFGLGLACTLLGSGIGVLLSAWSVRKK